MRELNPRAWIPILNRYATGFDDLYYHRQMNREGEWWCYPAGEDEPLDVEIELPTGLKDKNGKEIYELDIVEYSWDFCGEKRKNNYVVEWLSGKVEHYPYSVDSGFTLPDSVDGYMVVGNIHENKELIEAKNVD